MGKIDLTIDLERVDTEALLESWRWLVPEDFHPIQMSKFGDWFFVTRNGAVHMLDLLEGGTIHRRRNGSRV